MSASSGCLSIEQQRCINNSIQSEEHEPFSWEPQGAQNIRKYLLLPPNRQHMLDIDIFNVCHNLIKFQCNDVQIGMPANIQLGKLKIPSGSCHS